MNYKINVCEMVSLPKITDSRGDLTFVEGGNHIPFDIQRIYYLYNIPNGQERGGHAHKELQQLIIAISGSFDVILDDAYEKKRIHLKNPQHGLYVCPMIWRELDNFSPDAVCIVLASKIYDENDYYREYMDFINKKYQC